MRGRLIFIAVLAAGALAAGACSDDATTASSAKSSGSSSTSTTSAKPLVTVDPANDPYADPSHWLCRPDADDVCDHGLDSTTVAADGTLTVQPWKAATDPPIDCFYVYPTISRDPGGNSDWNASPDEEGYAAVNQVARLGQECRVFAPVYRQITLGALSARMSGGQSGGDAARAYGDVLAAWRHYLATDNGGRGVVLVGHSQGSGMLTQLIQKEIDPNPAARQLLVSAYLGGTSLEVPDGKDVGGAFQQVPLCRQRDQTGCALAWASFRSTSPPPPNSLFGRVRTGTSGAGGSSHAACVNPADLTGTRDAELHSYFPASRSVSILATLGTTTDSAATWTTSGTVTTPMVSTPGLVSGQCVSKDGFDYLSITVHPDPADPRADDIGGDLTPEWGLHLVDMNLVMGDMVDLVAAQTKAYLAKG